MIRVTQNLYEVKLNSGKSIAEALKGTWNGHRGVCRCPAHDDQNPSLSVRQDGDRLLVHCFSGCDQRAVVDALDRLGLWWPHRRMGSVPPSPGIDIAAERQRDAQRGQKIASRIWREAKPVTNTLGERYLLNRRAVDRDTLLPPVLRFTHGSGTANRNVPGRRWSHASTRSTAISQASTGSTSACTATRPPSIP